MLVFKSVKTHYCLNKKKIIVINKNLVNGLLKKNNYLMVYKEKKLFNGLLKRFVNFNFINSTLYYTHLTLIIALICGDEQERNYEDDLRVINANAVLYS